MAIQTHSYVHRGYNITIAHAQRFFQADIYATNPNLPEVDEPIRAANLQAALDLAKQRINEALARAAA